MEHKDIGNFIAERRKAKGLTQKQLAEKLYVSDKAISKWERNICLFDISLIQPLADILDVSINELLEGKLLDSKQDDEVIQKIKQISQNKRKHWRMIYILTTAFCLLATAYLIHIYTMDTLQQIDYFTYIVIAIVIGGYFVFFTPKQLPDYYDKNQIHFISTGIMRMNMPGIHFNNNNWFRISMTIVIWSILMMIICPFFFGISLNTSFSDILITQKTLICIIVLSTFFIPIIVCAKRYE
ncbi:MULTISPECIES: helix-turn-helix domain-containing protein [Bacillota]|jgi:transcriptional regulator with XRE-family HTH domain|uniref:Helix-turn-helix transcriptional regulator n=2 Tax=Amedibacillus TaxID=2749846 RepID=A0A7G9GTQ1_9FIRM|nr:MULTISPECIES: helix-turn-helix transcriptional regulator [Bacillota]QNM14183.1 helix-turn-helix transcriptional regulator [[Eubacterium] hominis]MCH4285600.1 helix-turn-helix domain-containing protein [Amedibacillus hominis]RGB53196.1 XRE family transcriptional regulator [Absiella sp. AM10-20]RGB54082.1 XRE family transcriptional regulator [Absiella sp. AM22-9]RGB64356.1 XRE family transcriptional regulator [Absiella sp. AM09-45]